MKMKNLFKTAVFAGTLVAGIAAASSLSVCASDDWETRYPNAIEDKDNYLASMGNPAVNYGKDETLLKMVKPGDIFFDATGSGGISGHIAIIEGVYYNTQYNKAYIRTIEAPGQDSCVSRQVLDLDRYTQSEENRILRLKYSYRYRDDYIRDALSFCERQIGIPYFTDFDNWYNVAFYAKAGKTALDALLTGGANIVSLILTADLYQQSWLGRPAKNYDVSEWEKGKKSWYCSELVYAAYYTASNGKINLNPGDNFCWPKEIRDAGKYLQDIGAYVIGNEVYEADYRWCNTPGHYGKHCIYINGQFYKEEYCKTTWYTEVGHPVCIHCGHEWC